MRIHGNEVMVYDDPVPHILWEDLKLNLTRDEYEKMAMRTLPSTYPVRDGLLVEDVERLLTKKWK